ncbi:MAG: fold metallo-hydrolase [Capsulimonas sp.]|jgi:glyoxylase-like metal-dependent hydrolase (beta-lactamase superfamily II)|nr:fold metallo-hydrolase [Capsulimonas sp.]
MENIYKIGDVTVTRVPELALNAFTPEVLYPEWDPEVAVRRSGWQTPGAMDTAGEHMAQSVHTWVVKTPNHTILIDTATGNDKDRPAAPVLDHLHEPYLERLAAAGVTPESVDYVLLTHIHVDHVGWNTRLVDGRWVPTFPNAKFVFSKIENDYFAGPPQDTRHYASQIGCYRDSVVPIIESGQAIMIEPGDTIDGLTYLPSPGHSLDHMSIRLTSRGEEALFSGDLMHHPIQVYQPQWNSVFCMIQDQARASRLWALEYAADRSVPFFSSHFADTSVGLVTRSSEGFDWRYI